MPTPAGPTKAPLWLLLVFDPLLTLYPSPTFAAVIPAKNPPISDDSVEPAVSPFQTSSIPYHSGILHEL